jgi:hypothetical protein
MLAELKREKALLDAEISEMSTYISEMKGSITHRSARFALKELRVKLTGRRHAYIQRINKLETENRLLHQVTNCNLDDEKKLRVLEILKRLEAAKLSPIRGIV